MPPELRGSNVPWPVREGKTQLTASASYGHDILGRAGCPSPSYPHYDAQYRPPLTESIFPDEQAGL